MNKVPEFADQVSDSSQEMLDHGRDVVSLRVRRNSAKFNPR